eukprot:1189082-Prorocentrum_minimum.AAC.1
MYGQRVIANFTRSRASAAVVMGVEALGGRGAGAVLRGEASSSSDVVQSSSSWGRDSAGRGIKG